MMVWTGGLGLWRLLPDPRHEETALMLAFVGVFCVPPLWLLLADRFTRSCWFERRPGLQLAVAVPSALSIPVVLTNSSHRLFVQGFGQDAMAQIERARLRRPALLGHPALGRGTRRRRDQPLPLLGLPTGRQQAAGTRRRIGSCSPRATALECRPHQLTIDHGPRRFLVDGIGHPRSACSSCCTGAIGSSTPSRSPGATSSSISPMASWSPISTDGSST